MLFEHPLVRGHQKPLPRRCARLLYCHILEACGVQTEQPTAEAHRAGSHEHNLPAFLYQFRNSLHDGKHPLRTKLAIWLGDGACAELDNYAACRPQSFAAILFVVVFCRHDCALFGGALERLGYAKLSLQPTFETNVVHRFVTCKGPCQSQFRYAALVVRAGMTAMKPR